MGGHSVLTEFKNKTIILQQLERELNILKEYIKMELENEDYHGVADAACDIREVQARIKLLKELEE